MKKLNTVLFTLFFGLIFSALSCDQGSTETAPAPECMVTFNADGGVFTPPGEDTLTLETADGGKLRLPSANPQKDDAQFSGWYTKKRGLGTAVTADTVIYADTTVYANWIPFYTVTFLAVEGTFPNGETSVQIKTGADGKVILPETPVKDGYSFRGWYTNYDGAGDRIVAGQVLTSSLVLYAWMHSPTAAPPYTVTFDADGGTPASVALETDNAGTVQFPSNPAWTGYTFNGWYTAKNGQGTQYSSGDAVSGNRTLYAFWKTATGPGSDPDITGFTFTVTSGLKEGNANAGAGQTAGTFSAVQGGTSPFTYSLAAGSGGNDADNGKFEVSGANLLVKGAALTAGTYRVYVQVKDSKNKTLGKAVSITVASPGAGPSPDPDNPPTTAPWKSTAYTDTPLGTGGTYASYGQTINIDTGDRRQTIDGFGGSNAWYGLPSNSTAADKTVKFLYSQTEGIGLTILRNHIPFNEGASFLTPNASGYTHTVNANGTKTFTLNWNDNELAFTKALITKIKALSNGPESLKVMSTPWTPPKKWKTNGRDQAADSPTGKLKTEYYNDYADLMADYAKGFSANMGTPLTILSVQNEPMAQTSYEGCIWTADEIKNYLNVIGDRFYLKGVGTNLGIMAAEDENFDERLVTAALADAGAKAVLTHVGVHQYNGGYDGSGKFNAKKLSAPFNAGKRIWETEMSNYAGGGHIASGTGIDNAIDYARMVHADMTIAELNAFLYWWLYWDTADHPGGTDTKEEALVHITGGTVTPAKRLWAIGHWSRFVRPGWYRVGATETPSNNISVSAYYSGTADIAIVLINNSTTDTWAYDGSSNSGPQKRVIKLASGSFSNLKAYRTSATQDLAEITAPTASGDTITGLSLPPRTITTIVGKVQ